MACVAVLAAAGAQAHAKSAGQWYQGVVDAADYMLQFQNDDGGFPWKVTNPDPASYDSTQTSPANTLGATARGLVLAYQVTLDTRYRDAANAVADLIEYRYDNDVSFGSYGPPFYNKDVTFAYELAALGGRNITTKAKASAIAYFQAKLDSYSGDPNVQTYADAVYQSYVDLHWTAPAGELDGAKMWMLGDWAQAGKLLGNTQISADPGVDYTGDDLAADLHDRMAAAYGTDFDPDTDTYSTLGLYGMLEAAFWGIGGPGTPSEPGGLALAELKARMDDPGSYFGYQSLGYTTHMLALMGDPYAGRGSAILLAWQRDDGAWIYEDYPAAGTDSWYGEGHGEALMGLAAAPVPEPLTILGVLTGVAGIGAYIRKRRMA